MDLYSATVNCYVHIFMYAYYFMSSFRQCKDFSNRVKPLMTGIQLIQLIIIAGNCFVALLPSCGKTKLFYIQAAHAGILLIFFTHFFIKSYTKKKQK